ncbi:MAG: hypothetical protein IJC81_00205 [Clostridia bacterium]|nr:hypothetical protein [Clostridia bacterium]
MKKIIAMLLALTLVFAFVDVATLKPRTKRTRKKPKKLKQLSLLKRMTKQKPQVQRAKMFPLLLKKMQTFSKTFPSLLCPL